MPPAADKGVEVRLLEAPARLKTGLVAGGAAVVDVVESLFVVFCLEELVAASAGLLTTGIFKMVASFMGVQSRLVGGGVGLAGLENVATPIGLDDKDNRREFREDRGPMEVLKAEPDGELFPEAD